MSDTPAIAEAARCPSCEYQLTGLTVNRCPECGRAFDPAELAATRIPWEQRRSLGLIRAYLRTVYMVTFRPGQLVGERGASLRYVSARRFAHVTTALASLPLLGAFAAFVLDDPIGWIAAAQVSDWIVIGSIPICGVLAVAACIGLPSYFFHPRSIPMLAQNRAIALSYYAAAPLALLPLLTAPLITLGLLRSFITFRFEDLPLLVQAGSLVISMLAPVAVSSWWLLLVRLAKAIIGRPGRAWLVALLIPVLWLVVGGGIGVGLPLSFAFLGIVYESLR